ncbi:MAG: hypothetical protein NVS3B25_05950 [Hymenobacter sp.]
MRRAMRPGARVLALAAGLLPAAHAQITPGPRPVPVASPRPDSVKAARPTFVADTGRARPVVTAAPSEALPRRLALRTGAAIVVLTLTTLLLYNVRSR